MNTIENFWAFRRLVKPEDLNPANRLFGGRILEWADEAAALYAMCQMQSRSLVTLKISEVIFKKPVFQGDILDFYCTRSRVGKSSMNVVLQVKKKDVAGTSQEEEVFCCEFIFVRVDENGKSVPHGIENQVKKS